MSTFREFLTEQLQDPEFRAEYEALEPEFAVIQAMIDARKNAGVTQTERAVKPHKYQLSNIESGEAP